MVTHRQQLKMSVAAYLALDNASEEKYEYIDGYAYMLAGGSPEHSLIKVNLTAAIRPHLRGSSCRLFDSDSRVKLPHDRYAYPDLTVSCDERDKQKGIKGLEYPCLIVEVLSPSTMHYDRGAKGMYYRACSTIQEYVLVDSQQQFVEVYRRVNDNMWTMHSFGLGDQIELTSIGLTLPVALIYEDVELQGNSTNMNE